MITCSVCGYENDDLAILCSSCKSFVQGRVDALNLFQTIWGIIESPTQTFRRIVLAKHKNYTLFLSSLSGITLVLEIAWYKNVIDRIHSLPMLMGIAVGAGPILGILFVFTLTYVIHFLTHRFGGTATRKNLFAALAYAVVPLVLSLVFLIPIELAVFGPGFFGTNPPPMTVRPFEYSVLLGMKALTGCWVFFLLVHATMAANAFGHKKVLPVSLVLAGLVCVLTLGVKYVKL